MCVCACLRTTNQFLWSSSSSSSKLTTFFCLYHFLFCCPLKSADVIHDQSERYRLPPTANRQPPTANREPPTANREPPTANQFGASDSERHFRDIFKFSSVDLPFSRNLSFLSFLPGCWPLVVPFVWPWFIYLFHIFIFFILIN